MKKTSDSRLEELARGDFDKLINNVSKAKSDLEKDDERIAFTGQPIETRELASAAARKGDNNAMTNPTREEIDAKFDLLSARSDARARETELQAEARLARFEERIDQAISEMRRDRTDTLKKIDDLQIEVRSEAKSTRLTLVVTAVTSILTIVGGVAAFNATVLGNMTASFEAGKTTMQSINETTNRLEALQSKFEAQATARATASQSNPPMK